MSENESIRLKLGKHELQVSRDVAKQAGIHAFVEADTGLLSADTDRMSKRMFAAIASAITLGMRDDDAVLWAVTQVEQKVHEAEMSRRSLEAAEAGLRTAQINLATEKMRKERQDKERGD